MSATAGGAERVPSVDVASVDVGPSTKEEGDDIRISATAGGAERGPLVQGAPVHVISGSKEE